MWRISSKDSCTICGVFDQLVLLTGDGIIGFHCSTTRKEWDFYPRGMGLVQHSRERWGRFSSQGSQYLQPTIIPENCGRNSPFLPNFQPPTPPVFGNRVPLLDANVQAAAAKCSARRRRIKRSSLSTQICCRLLFQEMLDLLLMAEILHQLIGSLSHFL